MKLFIQIPEDPWSKVYSLRARWRRKGHYTLAPLPPGCPFTRHSCGTLVTVPKPQRWWTGVLDPPPREAKTVNLKTPGDQTQNPPIQGAND